MVNINLILFFYYLASIFLIKVISKNKTTVYIVSTLPLVIALSIYVNRTLLNILIGEGIDLVPFVDRYLNNNLNIYDFLLVRDDHLLIGYKLLTLLNVTILKWDVRLDGIIFIISSISMSCLIYIVINKDENNRSLFKIFTPLALICFSLSAPPGLFMSTQFSLAVFMAALIAEIISSPLNPSDNRKNYQYQLILSFYLILYFFLLSSFYFTGLISGIAVVLIYQVFFLKKNLTRRFTIGCIYIVIFSLIMAGLYVASKLTIQNVDHPKTLTLLTRLELLITSPLDLIKSILAGIGGSVMDIHSLENNMYLFLPIGAIIIAILLWCLFLFRASKIYRFTYLPIFFIGYSIGIILTVRLGRADVIDWQGAVNEWYAIHLRPLSIGIVWILLYSLLQEHKSQYLHQIQKN